MIGTPPAAPGTGIGLERSIRPRFRVVLPGPPSSIATRLRQALTQPGAPCEGKVEALHVTLQPHKAEQHYWSPQLGITLEEDAAGTLVRGLYGPRPAVWTMFVFFYAVIGFAALVVAVVGTSFLTLGKSGAVLWSLPVLVLVFLSLYLVAYFGKRAGRDQIVTLHHFLEDCLQERIGSEH